MTAPGEKADTVIEAVGLTKRYGDLTAVDGLSFKVRRGEILGFLGPNGAGKSTSVQMLAGLLRPDGGEIRMAGNGAKSRAVENGDRKLRIGLSPQEIVVWPSLTCREQLTFMGSMYDVPRKEASTRAEALLSAFGLLEKRNRTAATLSGGMQRRLNIALALMHRPEVLILDEPQAGLDPQSRVLVRDYIKGLRGEATVIVTTHDMEEAEKISDRVCIVDRGKRLALGTVASVKGDFLESRGEAVTTNAADITLEDVFIGMTGRGLRE